jgi:type IX secretion system PorP/SprF family membrane protein
MDNYNFFTLAGDFSEQKTGKLSLRKSTVFVLFYLFSVVGFSQQMPVFTQYDQAMMYTNAGFAGMGDGICVNGLMRLQWSGFKDEEGNKVAPETYLISVNSPVKVLHGGIGGSIISDKIGFEQNISINLSYSYHLQLPFADLGMGLGVNIINKSIDFAKFKPAQSGDPLLTPATDAAFIFDADVGFFLKNPNYYIGLSVMNLIESKGRELSSTDNVSLRFQTDRTFYLTGAYNFELGSGDFIITPGFMFQTDLNKFQTTIKGEISMKDKFFGGISYRIAESVGVMAGVKIKGFRLSYSYDIVTIKYGMPGSHELGLSYCFKIKGDHSKTSYKNTRYL